VLKRIENKESFYVYVGDPKCPWCRAVIETAIAKAEEYGVNEILYLEIWDAEGNEILRDKYELKDGKAVLVTEGAEGYSELLTAFDSLLDEYELKDGDTVVDVGEKRIYAPNYFRIEQGKAIRMTTAIPDTMEDPRSEISQEQLDFMAECFDGFFGE